MTLFAFIAPTTARNVLLVLIGGCYLGYHLYHLWRRAERKRKEGLGKRAEGPSAPQSSNNGTALISDCGGQGPARPTVSIPPRSEGAVGGAPSPRPIQQSNNQPLQQSTNIPPTDLSGEELYAQARAMPHQPIPDIQYDGEYLKMLALSAAKDYPRALAKLGDYALRRGCLVEAYYWLWRAKRVGMPNLERTLLQVRSAWANGGFRREIENEYEGFSHEQGTTGYALLSIDARYNVDAAKAWLAECAPEFLNATKQ